MDQVVWRLVDFLAEKEIHNLRCLNSHIRDNTDVARPPFRMTCSWKHVAEIAEFYHFLMSAHVEFSASFTQALSKCVFEVRADTADIAKLYANVPKSFWGRFKSLKVHLCMIEDDFVEKISGIEYQVVGIPTGRHLNCERAGKLFSNAKCISFKLMDASAGYSDLYLHHGPRIEEIEISTSSFFFDDKACTMLTEWANSRRSQNLPYEFTLASFKFFGGSSPMIQPSPSIYTLLPLITHVGSLTVTDRNTLCAFSEFASIESIIFEQQDNERFDINLFDEGKASVMKTVKNISLTIFPGRVGNLVPSDETCNNLKNVRQLKITLITVRDNPHAQGFGMPFIQYPHGYPHGFIDLPHHQAPLTSHSLMDLSFLSSFKSLKSLVVQVEANHKRCKLIVPECLTVDDISFSNVDLDHPVIVKKSNKSAIIIFPMSGPTGRIQNFPRDIESLEFQVVGNSEIKRIS